MHLGVQCDQPIDSILKKVPHSDAFVHYLMMSSSTNAQVTDITYKYVFKLKWRRQRGSPLPHLLKLSKH